MRASPPRRATSETSQPLWVSDWWLPEPAALDVVGRREAAPLTETLTEVAVSGRELAIRGTRQVAVQPN